MESMVEENRAINPLSHNSQSGETPSTITSSVIQSNQQSVIQTAANIQPVALSKGNIILVSKPNSVIQTAQGCLQAIEVVDTGSEESYSDGESPKKRRDFLSRRPSYRKILNDLGGGEIAVISANAVQLANQGDDIQGLQTLNNVSSVESVSVNYSDQDTPFFVPAGSSHTVVEDAARKREMRLLKNREAARECRRKKKEYIKCLENRVAVLENRNQTLIDELKSLKELYQQKSD